MARRRRFIFGGRRNTNSDLMLSSLITLVIFLVFGYKGISIIDKPIMMVGIAIGSYIIISTFKNPFRNLILDARNYNEMKSFIKNNISFITRDYRLRLSNETKLKKKELEEMISSWDIELLCYQIKDYVLVNKNSDRFRERKLLKNKNIIEIEKSLLIDIAKNKVKTKKELMIYML